MSKKTPARRRERRCTAHRVEPRACAYDGGRCQEDKVHITLQCKKCGTLAEIFIPVEEIDWDD